MRIKDIKDYIGTLEPVRIIGDDFKEISRTMSMDLPKELFERKIKHIYAVGSLINIIVKGKG